MQSDWQHFLNTQGAIIESGTVQHFGDLTAELTAARDAAVLCDISHFARLRISGADAESFLQNLLSNDIREVTASRAQLSSFNSAKGRMLATFLIWREADDYLLQLPGTLAEALRKKLGMYVLRAKVKITDTSDEIISFGLSDVNFPDTELLGVTDVLGARLIRLDDARYQLNTTPELAPELWEKLARQARPAGSACWDWLNVRAGMPVIVPETQEQFVPQMANLDLIGGINFKKGCYPGQEIVARMHYLGKLKRRMYLAHIDSETHAGDEVYGACAPESDMAQAQPCGMIANAAMAPAGGYDALVVMQIESHDSQTVHLNSPQGATLNFESLPYPLP